jgi:hypothetical protein
MPLAAHHAPPRPVAITIPTSEPPLRPAPPTTWDGPAVILQQFRPVTTSTWWAEVASNSTPRTFVVRTVDAGQSWQDVTPSVLVGSSFLLDVLDADVAWAQAEPDPSLPFVPVYRTLDGGRSWQREGTVPTNCPLDFVDELHGWCDILGAASGQESVVLERTSDGGRSWRVVSQTAMAPARSTPEALPVGCDKTITFTSATVGWATSACNGGLAYLAVTDDAGFRWFEAPPLTLPRGTPAPEGESLGVPVAHGSDVTLSVDIGGQPGATVIDTSSDGGRSWRTRSVPGGSHYWQVDLIDQTHWRLTDGTVLMATDDAGADWTTSALPTSMERGVGTTLTVDFLSPLVGWAFSYGAGGPVWRTDGESAWTPVMVVAGPYALTG